MTQIDVGASEWSSPEDVSRTFTRLIGAASAACEWLKNNKPRNDTALVEFNFLACSVTYLEIVRERLPCPIQLLALCARSEYELYLLAKKVFSSDLELRRWLSETASDNLALIEATSALLDHISQDHESAKQEIDAFQTMLRDRGLNENDQPRRLLDLAREFGLEVEHRALFKLYSKLVHPSAFLINGGQYNNDQTIATTLTLKTLEYADAVLRLVGRRTGVPDGIMAWNPKSLT
jgi:hypothetical protein